MDAVTLATLAISGIVLGGLYALISTGLTFIWGTVGVLNFAHGAFITWSAYVMWLALYSLFDGNIILAFCLTVFASFFFGLLIELAVFRPLRWKPNAELNSIYASMGVAVCLTMLALTIFGPRNRRIPPLIEGYLSFAGLSIEIQEMLVLTVSITALVVFWQFLRRTYVGAAMRAVAQDMEAAQTMGIDVNMIYLMTIGLGSAMAGVTAIFIGHLYWVYPSMGDVTLLKAFIIITFGGLGSIRGTILAAVILGFVEVFGGFFLGLQWALPFMFALMMAVLVLRPEGLLGRKV